MPQTQTPRGPWFHRFLIGLFTILLTLLAVWLIGFVLDDIESIPGPQYPDVEARFLSQALLDNQKLVQQQLSDTARKLEEHRSRQSLLRDSTSRYEQTMKQLVELQRLNVEKGVTPEETAQKALAESVVLFLSNQKSDQALNEEIASVTEQQRALEDKKRETEKKLEAERKPAREEFARLQRQHDRRLAAFKLLFLLPLLAGVGVVFLKKRSSAYSPIIYASGVAVLWQTILVIHQHFPTRYFKYIVLLAALAVVAYTLVALLKMVRAPKKSWLLKQYREAYQNFVCPICEYPIRRGSMKNLFWTRSTVKKLQVPPAAIADKEESYTCPSCGARLFEDCASCHGIRHSLLPYCEKCGAEETTPV
jgi:predicted RNA-binding Zn-ribbon protein involved in translation (DUF1610 family)